MNRDHILAELRVMEENEKQQRNVFKARAYGKVIAQIAELKLPAGRDIASVDDLTEAGVKGIGESIRAKITEILATGHLAAADKARAGLSILKQLKQVYGIGPVKAKELVEEHGVTSLADLRRKAAADPKLLNEKQKIGIRYVEDLELRIPRAEMVKHEAVLLRAMAAADARFEGAVVGSFRREAQDSGDVDVLLKLPAAVPAKEAIAAFKKVIAELEAEGYIEAVLALGDKKCMAVCRLAGSAGAAGMPARRLDLLLTPENEYPYALLYFTGSDKFNIAFRQRALEKGYTLNEHTMAPLAADTAPPPTPKSERDIFDFLKIKWVEPRDRKEGAVVAVE